MVLRAILCSFFFALALIFILSNPVRAHHLGGHDDDDIPMMLPAIQPHLEPPPAPPPPPPTPLQINFQAPILPPNTLPPTDVSGIGGALGRASGLKCLLGGVRSGSGQKQSKYIVPRDDRYSFTGDWLSLDADDASLWNEESSNSPSTPVNGMSDEARKGRVVFSARKGTGSPGPVFMATDKAHYTRLSDNELQVKDGAVLVKPGPKTVFVSTEMKGRKVLTKVGRGSIALVSKMNDQATVVNLTDCKCGSTVMCCCSTKDQSSVSIPVELGQIAELCPAEKNQAAGNGVTSKVLAEHKLDPGLHLKVGKCHYVSTIRRFNLDKALSAQDLNRVMKTAAAALWAQRPHTQ